MAVLDLPPGYRLDYGDADVVALLAPDGKVVARFTPNARGDELVAAAEEHSGEANASIESFSDLLGWRQKGCGDPLCGVCRDRGLVP